MKQGELFAGIGGFGLAGRWAGIESVFQVEWNPFCQKVLKKNFPNAQQFGDIREFDGRQFAGAIDIISGGFPCQPYSVAGKRLGKEDERHLWPEMLRVIREVQPRWIVGENVRGLVNWSNGLVFDEVQADMESSGYSVASFVLPAASVGANHRRDRCWIIAHSASVRFPAAVGGFKQDISVQPKAPTETYGHFTFSGEVKKRSIGDIRAGDGIPNWMDRISAIGNAIVPQVAYRIFETIKQYDQLQKLGI